jgi:hypothetical protein
MQSRFVGAVRLSTTSTISLGVTEDAKLATAHLRHHAPGINRLSPETVCAVHSPLKPPRGKG